MSTNILESYLVSLGFQIEDSSFNKFKNILSQAEQTVISHSAGMAKHVLETQGAIVGAFGAVSAAIIGVVDKTAMADQSYRLLGLSMLTTTENARKLDMIQKALGASLGEIVYDKEHSTRAREYGDQIDRLNKMLGPDFKGAMKGVRDIRSEFNMLGIDIDYLEMKFSADLFTKMGGNGDMFKWLHKKVREFEDDIPQLSDKLVAYAIPALKDTWAIAKDLGEVVKGAGLAFTNLVGLFTGDRSIEGASFSFDKMAKAVGHVANGMKELATAAADAEKFIAMSAAAASAWASGDKKSAKEAFDEAKGSLNHGSEAVLGVGVLGALGGITGVLALANGARRMLFGGASTVAATVSIKAGVVNVTGLAGGALGAAGKAAASAAAGAGGISAGALGASVVGGAVATGALAFLGKEIGKSVVEDAKHSKGSFMDSLKESATFSALAALPGPYAMMGALYSILKEWPEQAKKAESSVASPKGPIPYGEAESSVASPKGPIPYGANHIKELPSSSMEAIVAAAAEKYGISKALALAVAKHESGFNPNANNWGLNKDGTVDWGLMQLNDLTIKTMGVKNPLDPTENAEAGSKLLASLLKHYGGDEAKALAAYSAGQGRIDRTPNFENWPEITKKAVPKILQLEQQFMEPSDVARSVVPVKPNAGGAAYHLPMDTDAQMRLDALGMGKRGGDAGVIGGDVPSWFNAMPDFMTQSPIWYGMAPTWLTRTPEGDSKAMTPSVFGPSASTPPDWKPMLDEMQRPATPVAASNTVTVQQTVDIGGIPIYITQPGADAATIRRTVQEAVSEKLNGQIQNDLVQLPGQW